MNNYIDQKKIAFYPFTNCGVSYIHSMQNFLAQKYLVIDYLDVKKELIVLNEIKCIYLNWIENTLDELDRQLLKKAKIMRVKIIWVFHNRLPHDTKSEQQDIDNIKFLISICDSIIIHSLRSTEYLLEYSKDCEEKVEYIQLPNFIDDYGNFGKFDLYDNKNNFVFGLIGNIRPYKNIELLIEAFEKILNYNKNITLVIAGKAISEEYSSDLKKATENNENIIFCDKFISDLEMGTLLGTIDLMVLPYDVKSGMNSSAMIMAFSYKKSVIVSDIAMVYDFDEKLIYRYSYLSDVEHAKKLEDAMLRALNDGKNAVKMKGVQLYQVVKKQNDKKYVEKKLLELIER